ncbi:MAG: rod-binding protein, partial [Epsilonproteobacteria bacterium]|nr:rod-binding protein [Campylobacterota bacterium]
MQVDNSVALMNANYSAPFSQTKSQASDALLKEQTDKFEAFFLKQVLDIAMNSEEENG